MDQGHVHVPQPGDDSSVPASHAFSTLTNIASIISGSGEQPVGQQAFQAYQHNGAHQESGGKIACVITRKLQANCAWTADTAP